MQILIHSYNIYLAFGYQHIMRNKHTRIILCPLCEYSQLTNLHIGVSFEPNSVQVLATVVPDDISGRSWMIRAPILNISDLSAPPVTTVLILPLPIDTTHNASAGEYTTSGHLLAFPTGLHEHSEKNATCVYPHQLRNHSTLIFARCNKPFQAHFAHLLFIPRRGDAIKTMS